MSPCADDDVMQTLLFMRICSRTCCCELGSCGQSQPDYVLVCKPLVSCESQSGVGQRERVTLACGPGVPLHELMEALMGRLSPEFRAEEGVRLGMQLSYIDEELRVSRCTTRQLAGYCTVHTRRDPPSTD